MNNEKTVINYNFIKFPDGSGTLQIIDNVGDTYEVNQDHSKYEEILERVRNGVFEGLFELISPKERFIKEFKGTSVTLEDGQVYVNGTPVCSGATNYLVEQIEQGFTYVNGLPEFIEKLQQNPSMRAREHLFDFLIKGGNARLPNGNFLAYKYVTQDYKDCYTERFDNSPGTIVEVPRNEVDDDFTKTCSKGLHVCSKEYLSHIKPYTEGGCYRVVSVEVNPKDVVAIPPDYNQSKMRVCSYYVVEDITDSYRNDPLRYSNYYDKDYEDHNDYDDDYDDHDDDYDDDYETEGEYEEDTHMLFGKHLKDLIGVDLYHTLYGEVQIELGEDGNYIIKSENIIDHYGNFVTYSKSYTYEELKQLESKNLIMEHQLLLGMIIPYWKTNTFYHKTYDQVCLDFKDYDHIYFNSGYYPYTRIARTSLDELKDLEKSGIISLDLPKPINQ